jgi:hypothetical protein
MLPVGDTRNDRAKRITAREVPRASGTPPIYRNANGQTSRPAEGFRNPYPSSFPSSKDARRVFD